MTLLRRTVEAQVRSLGEDEVEIIVSTGNLVRQDGYILPPQCCDLDDYRRNPIWLWSHDGKSPVGRAEAISVEIDKIIQRVRFAPLGISPIADQTRGLVKAGIVSAASIGFEVDEWDWVDPKKPQLGRRASRWVLFECSFVSVPADPDALVTARLQSGKRSDMAEEWKVGAARNLPIEDSDDWDGPGTEKSIFEHAGGDDFDPAKARVGFLVYDASEPKVRGSYKLPIAHVVDGELKVPKGAIRAAASRLPQTDIPDDTKEEAGKVLEAYKKKAGMDDDGEHSRKPRRRVKRSAAPAPRAKLRGMYGVAQLAYALAQLGYAQQDAEIEASLEGDGSQVPAMLKKNLADLGETLVAMTVEEVKELIDDDDDTYVTDGLAPDEVVIVGRCKTLAAKRFRSGFFRARAAVLANRAGKALSAANAERLQDAENHHKRAMNHHAGAVECHEAIGEHHRAIEGAQDKAKGAHTDLTDELGKGDKADLDRCMRSAKMIGRNLDAIKDENTVLGDEHAEMGDCHRGISRSVRAANRCLRDVDGFEPEAGDLDGDSELVQKSDGAADDEGDRDADFIHRQAAMRQRQAIAA